MGFSRLEYWNGLPRPPPGDLPDPEIESVSLPSSALAGRFFTTAPPAKVPGDFSAAPKRVDASFSLENSSLGSVIFQSSGFSSSSLPIPLSPLSVHSP